MANDPILDQILEIVKQQNAADAVNFVRGMKGIRIATIMGGMPYGKQIQALKGALLVVATPGRLLDLCDSKAIRLDDVQQLLNDLITEFHSSLVNSTNNISVFISNFILFSKSRYLTIVRMYALLISVLFLISPWRFSFFFKHTNF